MLSINCPHIAAGRGVAHDVINGYLVACLAADCLQRSPESVKPQASRFYAMFCHESLKARRNGIMLRNHRPTILVNLFLTPYERVTLASDEQQMLYCLVCRSSLSLLLNGQPYCRSSLWPEWASTVYSGFRPRVIQPLAIQVNRISA